MEFATLLLEHRARRHRVNVIGAGCVSVVILGFAGFMVWHSRGASALDAIKSVRALGEEL